MDTVAGRGLCSLWSGHLCFVPCDVRVPGDAEGCLRKYLLELILVFEERRKDGHCGWERVMLPLEWTFMFSFPVMFVYLGMQKVVSESTSWN
ncbi:hypothetical protein TNIN_442271 [Trichonephila inaurata madagascariensis]|uniref:Uncharacterized protein n=1 Tax=Trichonephila inaurata madagascariensis TaxID=2747483 RepID=A0A8X6JVN0_9ARAC|nr:hypothetical protein TNIN_442271 [Trichonephila inaurata madagascariensis]